MGAVPNFPIGGPGFRVQGPYEAFPIGVLLRRGYIGFKVPILELLLWGFPW